MAVFLIPLLLGGSGALLLKNKVSSFFSGGDKIGSQINEPIISNSGFNLWKIGAYLGLGLLALQLLKGVKKLVFKG